ncbi:MAG: FeoB-associated Cys-rich membrane protein [Bacteroidales bacterium]|nr:FeoB-associated Cys-rich membrane protein [Bacteroidales bacterium]
MIQTVVVILIVLIAAFFALRKLFRTVSGKDKGCNCGCNGSCTCCKEK